MYPCVQHFCFHVCPLYFHLFNLCKFCPVVQYCLRISFLASNCHLHFCNYLHLLGLCAAAPFTCLRVSYFVFHFSFPGMRISVVCLYPSDDVQRFISEIFQRFQCQSRTKNLMFPPLLKFVENILFSLRVLSSIGFKKSFREYNQQARRSRFRHNQVSFLLFS